MHMIADSLDLILMDMDTQIDRMCSKVHKLPSELLIRIFQEATAQDRDPSRLVLYTNEEYYAFAGTVHSLITLSSVCRRWRELMVGCPVMWTYVDAKGADRLEQFWIRSQALPLSLFVDVDHMALPQPRELIPMQSSRGRPANDDDDEFTNDWRADIQVEARQEPWGRPVILWDEVELKRRAQSVLTILKKAAPRLHRLDLISRDPRIAINTLLSSFAIPNIECLTLRLPRISSRILDLSPSPTALFKQSDKSSLKALAISQISTWIPLHDFPALTHLYLSFGHGRLRLETILEILRRTPNLLILHIASAQLVLPAAPTIPQPPVSLDKLRSLVFTRCPASALQLVSYLTIAADVCLRACGVYVTEEAPFPVVGCFNTSLGGFTQLSIKVRCELQCSLLAEGPATNFSVEGDYISEGIVPDANLMLLGLHTRLSLAAVTWIRVTLEYLDAATLVEGVLKHTPQLTHLEMWATSCMSSDWHTNAGEYFLGEHIVLCRALSARDPVLCPALHSLALRYDGLSGAERSARYDGAVETMLASRAAAGHPLRSLFPPRMGRTDKRFRGRPPQFGPPCDGKQEVWKEVIREEQRYWKFEFASCPEPSVLKFGYLV